VTVRVRPYNEAVDAGIVGRLIADTFRSDNLSHLDAATQSEMLGPFRHARSKDPVHQQAVREAILSEIVLVAERQGRIIGVLRGRPTRLGSLFVLGEKQRSGIGRTLVNRFEEEVRRKHGPVLHVAATLNAVPFYKAMGYKRSTGVRSMRIFDGDSFEYQPMRKVLSQRKT